LFTIGEASFPNGQPLSLFAELGVPTRSIMTVVVNQKEANIMLARVPLERTSEGQTEREPGHDKTSKIVGHLNM
jgi:hypothetical protein